MVDGMADSHSDHWSPIHPRFGMRTAALPSSRGGDWMAGGQPGCAPELTAEWNGCPRQTCVRTPGRHISDAIFLNDIQSDNPNF